MSSNCLLASVISDEKSVINLIQKGTESFLAAFKVLSLSLAFNRLIMIYLSFNLSEFILLGVHSPSWMCKLMVSITFGEFSAIIFSIFSLSITLSSLLLGLPLRICRYT